jgi:hypothetical protein
MHGVFVLPSLHMYILYVSRPGLGYLISHSHVDMPNPVSSYVSVPSARPRYPPAPSFYQIRPAQRSRSSSPHQDMKSLRPPIHRHVDRCITPAHPLVGNVGRLEVPMPWIYGTDIEQEQSKVFSCCVKCIEDILTYPRSHGTQIHLSPLCGFPFFL